MPLPESRFIVLYDGACGLCDRWVQFVLAHDRTQAICFAPLQSAFARELLKGRDQPPELLSVIVCAAGRVHFRSDAVCRILREMGGVWKIAGAALRLVPKIARDGAYNFVAARRHTWFAARDPSCRVATDDEKKRFLA